MVAVLAAEDLTGAVLTRLVVMESRVGIMVPRLALPVGAIGVMAITAGVTGRGITRAGVLTMVLIPIPTLDPRIMHLVRQ
jgi:hypothetical protein